MAVSGAVAYGAIVHPIEHLRYVARSGAIGGQALVSETAYALASLGVEHADLLISCRRILARHPYAGALWAACARLVLSPEPARLAWELVDRSPVDVDAVGGHLPADAALVGPAEWGADAFAAAAIEGASRELDGASAPIDLDVALDVDLADLGHLGDLGLVDDIHRPMSGPTVKIVDDGGGAADLLRRSLRRLDVAATVVAMAELEGAAVVVEPTLVAVDTVIVPATVASSIDDAATAGLDVWALVNDVEILPAAFGAAAIERIDVRRWTAIDPAVLAGVIGEAGRRSWGDVAASVPFTPELLRAPV